MTASKLLYVMHLAIAFYRQTQQSGERDQYSGTSHLMRFVKYSEIAEQRVHLWLEPALILIVSIVLRFIPGWHAIGSWLSLVALSMWCKEGINYWYHLRREKRQQDMREETMESAQEQLELSPPSNTQPTSRKAKVKRSRAAGDENAPREN